MPPRRVLLLEGNVTEADLQIDREVTRLTLSEQDAGHFEQAETVIREGLRTFFEVGSALAAIRENRWYQAKGFITFEAYCREEWGIGQSHAYRLMDAAEVVADLAASPIGELPLPANEAQARALKRVDAADRPIVWQEATANSRVSGKPVTASTIDAAATRLTERKEKPAAPSPALRPAQEPSRTVPAGDWRAVYRRVYWQSDKGKLTPVTVELAESPCSRFESGRGWEITIAGRFIRVEESLDDAKAAADRHIMEGDE